MTILIVICLQLQVALVILFAVAKIIPKFSIHGILAYFGLFSGFEWNLAQKYTKLSLFFYEWRCVLSI